MLSKAKQGRLRRRQVYTLNRATRGVKQKKARKVETVESSQQRAERLEVLSKPKQETDWDGEMFTTSRARFKQDLRLTQRQLCNVWASWGRFNYLIILQWFTQIHGQTHDTYTRDVERTLEKLVKHSAIASCFTSFLSVLSTPSCHYNSIKS